MLLLRLVGDVVAAGAKLEESNVDIAGILVPIVLFFSLFTFLSIAVWAGSRRGEREAFYRSEERKKMVEQSGAGAGALLELVHEEEQIAVRRRREGLKLGGLVTTAVGVGLIVMFAFLGDHDHGEKGIEAAGAIPLLIGIAMLVYVFFMSPKPEKK